MEMGDATNEMELNQSYNSKPIVWMPRELCMHYNWLLSFI